jgi:hypothetical protein
MLEVYHADTFARRPGLTPHGTVGPASERAALAGALTPTCFAAARRQGHLSIEVSLRRNVALASGILGLQCARRRPLFL